MYEKFASEQLSSICSSTLNPIVNQGYKIVIATKNVYATNLLNYYFSNEVDKSKIQLLVLRKNKKKKYQQIIKQYDNNICIIGNNLCDDIISSYKVGSPYIYIGKSKVVGCIIHFIDFMLRKIKPKGIYTRGIQLRNIKEIDNIFSK